MGRLADRYRLLDRLGAGGMSVVWRAHDEVLDRAVAVKVLTPDPAAHPGLADRILVEARAAGRLRHPHVVEVYDFGRDPSFVVMELVDGQSLADVLTRGALPWRSAVTIGAQVAAALAAAHAQGIVHRDVKPANVMVTASGVKLVDFGISASAGEADGIGGQLYGTPAYLAPERIDGGPVRPATDVYALGLLLHLMLAGRLPWDASTVTQMLRAHRYTTAATLPPIPGLPHEVNRLIRHCLTKQPSGRPAAATAARVLADAAGLVTPPPLLASLATQPLPTGVPRRRRVLVGAIAMVLAAVGGAGWFASRSSPQATAAATPAALQCTVGYAIRSALNGRFSTAVTVANTGATPAAAWHLTFELPAGQKLVRGWSTGWAQQGSSLRLTGKDLHAGRSVRTGFDASYSKAAGLPGQFRLNDTVCTPQLSVAGATTKPSPATRATSTTPATTRSATKPAPVAPAAKPKAPAPAKVKKAPKPKKDNSGKGNSDDDDEGDDDD